MDQNKNLISTMAAFWTINKTTRAASTKIEIILAFMRPPIWPMGIIYVLCQGSF